MLTVKKVKKGFILQGNDGKHAHGSKKYCCMLKDLILSQKKPTQKEADEHDTTIEYIEESILRLVSESRYRRWEKKKPKYVNVNKGKRRIV